MVFEIPEDGVMLETSAKATAGLPAQAFGISLSDSDIENLIACIQNGDTIELSLGSCPAFLFGDQEIVIPDISECVGYDLFQSDPSDPSELLNKLPNPTIGMFTPVEASKPKAKAKKAKAPPKPKESAKASSAKPSIQTRKAPSSESPKLAAVPDKGDVDEDDAIANLKNSLARVEADKNTAVVVPGLLGSKGKTKPSNRLLDNASPRSLPPSPALSGIRSPSLAAGSDHSRSQTFPIIHELALSELSFEDLFAKWNEGSEADFRIALNKVADFDGELQKWMLKKKQWKELDVFEYDYGTEEDRQTAIEHTIKQYDRQRVGPSDPIWQKLLPVAERGKGVCLSKLQAAFARGSAAPKPKGDSTSGSDKDESGSSSGMKGKGGEPMSRSSSQTSATGKKKLSASEAQAKRLLSNSKKPAAAAAAAAATPKASPKVSQTKPQTKGPPAKAGRVLSQEFITDSSSDDEVPLSLAKSKVAAALVPFKIPKEILLSKTKARPPLAVKAPPKEPEREKERERDTIRAEVVARPTKAAAKRQRTTEDDDSSSSGTPLSKRVKAGAKAPTTTVNSARTSSTKPRTGSDASQSGRGSVSAALVSKAKNTSPMKSSPLAASPPTNASDIEGRASRAAASERERERERDKEERERERQREERERENERLREEREREKERLREERERERERLRNRDRGRAREREVTLQRELDREREDTISSTSSGAESTPGVISKKRPATDSYSDKAAKKQRLSRNILEKALRFKDAYARYRLLHKEINGLEDPDPAQLDSLCQEHERLKKMKEEIYAEVPNEA